jgi:hypothetical protein
MRFEKVEWRGFIGVPSHFSRLKKQKKKFDLRKLPDLNFSQRTGYPDIFRGFTLNGSQTGNSGF